MTEEQRAKNNLRSKMRRATMSEEQKKKDKECKLRYSRRRRLEGQNIVIIPCKHCGQSVSTKQYKLKDHKLHGGITCKECWRSHFSESVIKFNKSISKEEKRQRGAKARALVKISGAEMVRRQWETIRSSPELYAKRQTSTSKATKKIWSELSEEQKNKRIKQLYACHGRQRSKGSDKLKQAMTDAGIYDGFFSEEPFCGFIPDEINHEEKIIVEYFGDYYHCNPQKYKNPDVYMSAIKRTVGEQQLRDQRRLDCFYKKGYRVIIIWESEFIKNPQLQIEKIKTALGQFNHNYAK